MTNCKLCIPNECVPCFLYVVHDPIGVTSKIGMSRRPVERFLFERYNGDWFFAPADVTIQILEKALGR